MVTGKRSMIRHMQSHTNKEIHCTYVGCQKFFLGKEALKNHILSKHEMTRNINCPTCGSAFATTKNMRKHFLRQHKAEKINCQVQGCSQSFARRDYLKRHYLQSHQELDMNTRSKLVGQIKDIKGISW